MTKLPVSYAAVLWIILCALSIFSVVQVEEGWWSWLAAVLVIVIAAAKAWLVIHHYMEAKHARPLWRVLYNAWNIVAAATIIAGYLLARSIPFCPEIRTGVPASYTGLDARSDSSAVIPCGSTCWLAQQSAALCNRVLRYCARHRYSDIVDG
jgi:hypothetical protein